MRITEAVLDVCVGVMAGYVATKVMETVSMRLYQLEPEEDRQREDAVRPGQPYEIAARKTAQALGIQLHAEQVKTLGKLFHCGLGMTWGPVYTLLRGQTTLNPVAAGLLTGTSLSLIVDEGLTPALGFSAPNRAYPLVTHLRGFAAHLVFGLAVALGAEAVGRAIPWRR